MHQITLREYLRKQRPMQGVQVALVDEIDDILWCGTTKFSSSWFDTTITKYLDWIVNNIDKSPTHWSIGIHKPEEHLQF